MFRIAIALCVLLAACDNQAANESMKVVQSSSDTLVLQGLIDATRTSPPERYDTEAASHCAQYGKKPVFVSMSQRTTYKFDVTYNCVAANG